MMGAKLGFNHLLSFRALVGDNSNDARRMGLRSTNNAIRYCGVDQVVDVVFFRGGQQALKGVFQFFVV
jgi:hypothetical protein